MILVLDKKNEEKKELKIRVKPKNIGKDNIFDKDRDFNQDPIDLSNPIEFMNTRLFSLESAKMIVDTGVSEFSKQTSVKGIAREDFQTKAISEAMKILHTSTSGDIPDALNKDIGQYALEKRSETPNNKFSIEKPRARLLGVAKSAGEENPEKHDQTSWREKVRADAAAQTNTGQSGGIAAA